jgi:hypothetical protein
MLIQQTTHYLHRVKEPRVMLKLDIAHVVDSASWALLFEVSRLVGFGSWFQEWLAILLSTSSTWVSLNGDLGPPVWHHKGLRHGDPLSPMLFALVIYTLNRLLAKAQEVWFLRCFAPKDLAASVLLYADDVVIFCHLD